LVDNPLIGKIVDDFDIDRETFYECLVQACRILYGILEIENFSVDEINSFVINSDGHLVKKIIRITKSGMTRIVKETVRQIEFIKNEDKSVLQMLSYKAVLTLLESDLFTISKSKVTMRVISLRLLSDKEKKSHPGINLFVIIRSSRYLNDAELRYFSQKSCTLKKGVIFVLD
jgi:hypothetical protein